MHGVVAAAACESEADLVDTPEAEPVPGRHRLRNALLLSLGLCAYALFFYRDLILANRVQVFRDLYTFLLPRDHAARLLTSFGWPPLWNPLHGLGRPFAADLQAAVYYPPYWVLRQLPEPLGFNLSIVLHHCIAAVGAFAWLRRRGLSGLAATLGALCLAFGGAAISLDHQVIWERSAAWMPAALYFFERWRAERHPVVVILLGGTLALILLGGQPEMFMLTVAAMIALLFEPAQSGQQRADGFAFGGLAMATLLALALCAVQIIPFAELLGQTDRRAGLSVEQIVEFSSAPAAPLAFLLPRPLTDRDGNFHAAGAFWQKENEAPLFVSLYLGAVLVLILPAWTDASPFRRRYWGAIAAAALILSFGKYLPGFVWLLTHVPALRFVRYPEKLMLIVHALLAVAVARGLDRVTLRPARLRLSIVVAAVAAMTSLVASWGVAHLVSPSPEMLSHDLLVMSLSYGLFAGVLSVGRRRPAVCAVAIIAFAAIDLLRVNRDVLPTVDWDTVRRPPRSFSALRSTGDPLRIYANRPVDGDAGPFPLLFLRAQSLMMDEASQFYGVSNVFTPGTVNLDTAEKLLGLISRAPRERTAGILGLFNVGYATSLHDLQRPGLSEVQRPSNLAEGYVYQVDRVAPRAFIAPELEPVARADDAIASLEHADDPSVRVAVTSGEMPTGLPAAMRGEVAIELYQPDRVRLRAHMETPGLIVLNDSYDPGWRVWVDDSLRPVVRANYFVRGVYAEAGEHRISFEYDPLTYTIGAMTSIGTCVLCVGAVVLSLWRRARREAPR